MAERYCKRLIEVDLPIGRISSNARREKSIRHGHPASLHTYWARRPLAACRAVLCATLWPDPADPLCPERFRSASRELMLDWARNNLRLTSAAGHRDFVRIANKPEEFSSPGDLRGALLSFLADFSDWENHDRVEYLACARQITNEATRALHAGDADPVVFDPFAGGGAIPLEAARLGAESFASDLNPLSVLINKVILEYVPRFGSRLVDAVEEGGRWVADRAREELRDYYPGADGESPISYIWARVVLSEAPGQTEAPIEIPLIRSMWLSKRGKRQRALRWVRDERGAVEVSPGTWTHNGKTIDVLRPRLEVFEPKGARDVEKGTVQRGSATCPVSGHTMPVARVREQLRQRRGGTFDARLLCVVSVRDEEKGRFYRVPGPRDYDALASASDRLHDLETSNTGAVSLVPDEPTDHYHTFVNRGPIYGMNEWRDYFTERQSLALVTLARLMRQAGAQVEAAEGKDLADAVRTCLAFCFDKQADLGNALNRWEPIAQCPRQLFSRQALAMVWDFAEGVPHGASSGSWTVHVDRMCRVLRTMGADWKGGNVALASATDHPLPDDSAHALVTDPPYYYSVQYADLSDFFYVWLRRTLEDVHPSLLSGALIAKDDEIIVQSPSHVDAEEGKNRRFYESRMTAAMAEARRVLRPDGVGVVVFAHTSTAGWEAMLNGIIEAGFVVTGSWPIDTEMASRVIAQGRSVLASSVHIVCRPRESEDGSPTVDVGDWRSVLKELPDRIHHWLPRLAEEGVVGADAIFSCLGPALEIYSRYSSVEKASGERVSLQDYLTHVWAAVSREALSMVFQGGDASGFEEDARLTAMWLWTLHTSDSEDGGESKGGKASEAEQILRGYVLEFDAARKIAQGLGVHLNRLPMLVETSADRAVLLSAGARSRHLFGSEDSMSPRAPKRGSKQMTLKFEEELATLASDGGDWATGPLRAPGDTVLDRLHQSMILFGAGQTEALRRFLVEEGAGREETFWRLAQALSALYPDGTSDKRWVDGVLARKKGLGL